MVVFAFSLLWNGVCYKSNYQNDRCSKYQTFAIESISKHSSADFEYSSPEAESKAGPNQDIRIICFASVIIFLENIIKPHLPDQVGAKTQNVQEN